MKKYMVQVDLADQSQIGVTNEYGVTLMFHSGPFKRKQFRTLRRALRWADKQPNHTLYASHWERIERDGSPTGDER